MSVFIAGISYGLFCLLSQVVTLKVNESTKAWSGASATDMTLFIIPGTDLYSLVALASTD